MRKYLATIFGVAVGVATAVLIAARQEDDERTTTGANAGTRKGGA